MPTSAHLDVAVNENLHPNKLELSKLCYNTSIVFLDFSVYIGENNGKNTF